MAKQNINTKQGFTIIEVVLVLAIAGLIFLMVFIAWPALQRSQRDTQRRNDYSMLSTAVSNYITNNGGKTTTLATAVDSSNATKAAETAKKFINQSGEDPNGYIYELKVVDCASATCPPTTKLKDNGGTGTNKTGSQVFIYLHADCTGSANGGSAPKKNTSSRAFAIYGYLESGSGSFCSASQ